MKHHNITGTIQASERKMTFPCIRKPAGIGRQEEERSIPGHLVRRVVFFSEDDNVTIRHDGTTDWGTEYSLDNTIAAPSDESVTLRIIAGDGSEFPRIHRGDTGNFDAGYYLVMGDKVLMWMPSKNEPLRLTSFQVVQHIADYNGKPLPPGTVTLLTIRNDGTPSERIDCEVEPAKKESSDFAIEVRSLDGQSISAVGSDESDVVFRASIGVWGQVASIPREQAAAFAQKLYETLVVESGPQPKGDPEGIQKALIGDACGKPTLRPVPFSVSRAIRQRDLDKGPGEPVLKPCGQWGPVGVGCYRVTGKHDEGTEPFITIERRGLPPSIQVPGEFSLEEADTLIDVLTEATNFYKGIGRND